MNARFYAPHLSLPGDIVDLPEDEARHLTRVLRLGAGAAVRVFDGRGNEFDARVEAVSRTGVRLRIGIPRDAAQEPRVAVTLAQAVLKGDKMDDVVRDAVMMGVSTIQPMVTVRTEVTRATIDRSKRLDRWERIAVSSAKQCGRAVVPPIRPPLEFGDVLDALAEMRLPNPAVMLAEPGATAGAMRLSEMDQTPPREATVLIGPEGGWAEEEIRRGAETCRLATMGGRTLRADAMSIVALAALFSIWKEF
jgi:16S rRNA (uracil1498-N3)-methyltransferase